MYRVASLRSKPILWFQHFFGLKIYISFILLPLPIEKYTTINTQNPKCSRACYKNFILLLGCPPTQNLLQSQKTVAVSHHNPGISLNFKKFSLCWRSIPCVETFLKYIFANSLYFLCLKKWTFKFPVLLAFPVPWQPWYSNGCTSKHFLRTPFR